MKRRIIKQGHNTLTITLPSEWVKRFNLKGGNEVEVLDRENGLFILTEKINDQRKTCFDIDDFDIPTIWKYFMAIYREGYDEVLVNFASGKKMESAYKYFSNYRVDSKYKKGKEDRPVLDILQEMMNRFMGWEIVNYGKNFVLIKDMGEPTSKEFDNSLRRVFLLIQQMSEETCEALKTEDSRILTHIHDVDINLDKFHDYCIRILNKTRSRESRKSELLFATLYLLEMIGDEFKTISHHLIKDFVKSNFKHIVDIALSLKEQLDLFYELYYKFNREKIIRMSEIDKERYFGVKEKYKEIKTEEEKEIFHHLRVIARYINALVELRIEMEV